MMDLLVSICVHSWFFLFGDRIIRNQATLLAALAIYAVAGIVKVSNDVLLITSCAGVQFCFGWNCGGGGGNLGGDA